IAKRRIEQPERAMFDTEAVFHHVTQYFEAPTASENLSLIRVAGYA
ncbi:1-deoxy-D-xylulose-5-phosphate synthase, partial [Vibrio parahaemolyticus]